MRFGLIEKYGKDADLAAKKGQVIVADVISGHRFVLPNDPEFFLYHDDSNEVYDWQEKQLEAALDKSDTLHGLQKGKLFSIGVADGCAWYEVVKVNKRTVAVEFRGYNPDRYLAPVLGSGGKFPRSAIERYCR